MINFTYHEQIALSIFLGFIIFIVFSEKKNFFKNKIFKNKIIKQTIPYFIFVFITIFTIWQNNKLNLESLKLKNKKFVSWLILCILFTLYVLIKDKIFDDPDKNEKIKSSVRKSFIALIIAFFARIDMVIAPFFTVFVFSYFSDVQWV
jgi:hypothetical protein